jgi:hypothetical protein
MPDKIATAEDIQNEIRTLWAMTEEEAPSREKLAAALTDLAERVARGDSPDVDDLKKSIEVLTKLKKDLSRVLWSEGGIPNALVYHSLLVKNAPNADKLEKAFSAWHVTRGLAEVRLDELLMELETLQETIPEQSKP